MEVDYGRRRQFVGDVRVSIMCGCLFQNVFFCPGELPVACIFLPANLPVAPAKTDHYQKNPGRFARRQKYDSVIVVLLA